MIYAEFFKMVDFDVTGENHISISGGRATHSFDRLYSKKFPTASLLLKYIKDTYGEPFIFGNRLEVQVSESETISVHSQLMIEHTESHLKELFPTLETY